MMERLRLAYGGKERRSEIYIHSVKMKLPPSSLHFLTPSVSFILQRSYGAITPLFSKNDCFTYLP